jgi:hypothetical protein
MESSGPDDYRKFCLCRTTSFLKERWIRAFAEFFNSAGEVVCDASLRLIIYFRQDCAAPFSMPNQAFLLTHIWLCISVPLWLKKSARSATTKDYLHARISPVTSASLCLRDLCG